MRECPIVATSIGVNMRTFRGNEILDDPSVAPAIRARSIGDVTRSNRLLGGLRAAVHAFAELGDSLPTHITAIDVGTGLADIPASLERRARASGRTLTMFGMDEAHSLLVAARPRLAGGVCADALHLPFADRSVDLVLCSQLLHHFDDASAVAVLRELHRVARRAVIVSDLRRSRIAAAGFWLVSFPLRFHRVTRHDGVVSVMRGFTSSDLRTLIVNATQAEPVVAKRLGWRLTARWLVT